MRGDFVAIQYFTDVETVRWEYSGYIKSFLRAIINAKTSRQRVGKVHRMRSSNG